MIEFSTFTRKLLKDHLNEIIREVKGFKFNDWHEENFLRDMPDKWKFSIAVFAEKSLAGFSFNSKKANVFYIHFFYVFKEYRKTGIGKSLMEVCTNTTIKNNLKIMRLICHKDNTDALEFFYQNKFNVKETVERNSSLYLMEKILS